MSGDYEWINVNSDVIKAKKRNDAEKSRLASDIEHGKQIDRLAAEHCDMQRRRAEEYRSRDKDTREYCGYCGQEPRGSLEEHERQCADGLMRGKAWAMLDAAQAKGR
jgi:hypothetical protein